MTKGEKMIVTGRSFQAYFCGQALHCVQYDSDRALSDAKANLDR